MFSRPKILFLVSLLFVALLNSIPTYLFYHSSYTPTNRQTRYYHNLHYIIPSVRTNAYTYVYTVFFQEQLKNGTVSLQILLNAVPYNSSKTS